MKRFYNYLCVLLLTGTMLMSVAAYPQDTLTPKNESTEQQAYPLPHRHFDNKKWNDITKGVNYREGEEEPGKKEDKPDYGPQWNFQIPALNNNVAKIIFFTLVAAILIFILYKSLAVKGISNKKIKPLSLVNLDNMDEHIAEIDLHSLLSTALQQNEYNKAIRIYYLIIIQELSNKKLIVWEKDKTNGEYIRELVKTAYFNDFRKNTIVFERVWYGQRVLSKADYDALSLAFNDLLNQIKKEAMV